MARLLCVLAVLVAVLAFPAPGFAVLDTDADGVADTADTTRTVPAAAGANRLVVHDLSKALPPGRYRLEIWAMGSAKQLVSRMRLDVPERKA